MADPEQTSYTKLPGRGVRYASGITPARCRLWLGDDHLLAVDTAFMNEGYRRFYFRDIEAFIIRRTPRRQIFNAVFVVLGLLTTWFFLLAWSSDRTIGALAGAIGCALFWITFIVVNTLQGPTCRTHIRTAAQLEELPSLSRVRLAQQVLARMQPLIRAAQGKVTGEEVAAVLGKGGVNDE